MNTTRMMERTRFYDPKTDILSPGDDELAETVATGLDAKAESPYSKEHFERLVAKVKKQ